MSSQCSENKTCIVLVQYKNYVITASCIDSILNNITRPIHIYVCDNNSPDNSFEQLSKRFMDNKNVLTIIKNNTNGGYAAGVNICLRHARNQGYQYFWVLNNDCELTDDALTPLVELSEKHSDKALIGSAILDPKTRKVQSFGGKHIDYMSFSKHLYEGERVDNLPLIFEPDYLVGASIFASFSSLDEIGYMDENFFLYCEDVDWSIRARKCGYKLIVTSQSRIAHSLAASTKNFRNRKVQQKVIDSHFLESTLYLGYKLGFVTHLCVRLTFILRFIKRLFDTRIIDALRVLNKATIYWPNAHKYR